VNDWLPTQLVHVVPPSPDWVGLTPADCNPVLSPVSGGHYSSGVAFAYLGQDQPPARCAFMARILIADDAATVRVLLRRHLLAAGHDVVEVEDGTAAYEAGSTGDFDLAVLDQLMPGLLGTEVMSKWKEDGLTFPVLVLTAVDDDDTAVRSFELGAADYIRKPFTMSELNARINGRLRAQ